MLKFDNRFLNELPGEPGQGNGVRNHSRQVLGVFWSRVETTSTAKYGEIPVRRDDGLALSQ